MYLYVLKWIGINHFLIDAHVCVSINASTWDGGLSKYCYFFRVLYAWQNVAAWQKDLKQRQLQCQLMSYTALVSLFLSHKMVLQFWLQCPFLLAFRSLASYCFVFDSPHWLWILLYEEAIQPVYGVLVVLLSCLFLPKKIWKSCHMTSTVLSNAT